MEVPTAFWLLCMVSGAMTGEATPYPCFAVMVWSGSASPCPRNSPAWLTITRNGEADRITNLSTPLATRRMVFLASGRTAATPYRSRTSSFVAKMEGVGRFQSMISAALRHGFLVPAFTSWLSAGAWVGSGHTMGRSSLRAIRKKRFRVVGAP